MTHRELASLLVMTHLIAHGLGLLVALLFKAKPKTATQETDMTSAFVKDLDRVGAALKKFFTSPLAADVESVGISIAEVVWPGATPLLTALQASIAKAQALAAAANVTGDTTSQVTALVLSDAQQAFQAYEQASGKTIETSQQTEIIQLVMNLLNSLPDPTSSATAASQASAAATQVSQTQPVAAPVVAAAAAAQTGPGLSTIVPQ